jgi:hypothetical protein
LLSILVSFVAENLAPGNFARAGARRAACADYITPKR